MLVGALLPTFNPRRSAMILRWYALRPRRPSSVGFIATSKIFCAFSSIFLIDFVSSSAGFFVGFIGLSGSATMPPISAITALVPEVRSTESTAAETASVTVFKNPTRSIPNS